MYIHAVPPDGVTPSVWGSSAVCEELLVTPANLRELLLGLKDVRKWNLMADLGRWAISKDMDLFTPHYGLIIRAAGEMRDLQLAQVSSITVIYTELIQYVPSIPQYVISACAGWLCWLIVAHETPRVMGMIICDRGFCPNR